MWLAELAGRFDFGSHQRQLHNAAGGLDIAKYWNVPPGMSSRPATQEAEISATLALRLAPAQLQHTLPHQSTQEFPRGGKSRRLKQRVAYLRHVRQVPAPKLLHC